MTGLESNLRNILSQKETKIIPENIKKNVTIFGVTGTLEEGDVDTTNATATENDIINPKTAYVNGEKITGNIMLNEDRYMKDDILSSIDLTNISSDISFDKKFKVYALNGRICYI